MDLDLTTLRTLFWSAMAEMMRLASAASLAQCTLAPLATRLRSNCSNSSGRLRRVYSFIWRTWSRRRWPSTAARALMRAVSMRTVPRVTAPLRCGSATACLTRVL